MPECFDYSLHSDRVAELATEQLAQAESAEALVRLMEQVAGFAESELAREIGDEARHIACRAGCGTCCAVNVSVLFPEAVAIADFLRREMAPAQLEQTRARLDELHREVRWLDDSERPFLRRSCAFLDADGSCSIYPVRPLICRSVTSTDAERCKDALVAPVFGEEVPVMMNLFQKSLLEVTFTALGEAVQDSGRDARGATLTSTVKRLLDNPGLAELFLAGERIY